MKRIKRRCCYLMLAALGISILWTHAHAAFFSGVNKYNLKGKDVSYPEEIMIEFPNHYQKEINDWFQFDMDISTGDADVNRITQKTAIEHIFDGQELKKDLLATDGIYEIWEDTETGWDDRQVQMIGYDSDKELLRIWEYGFEFAKMPLSTFIFELMSTDYGVEEMNYHYQISEENMLENFSKNEAWEQIGELWENQQMDKKELEMISAYTLDKDSMDRQEKNLVSGGDLEEKDTHGAYDKEDEGYFFFLEQHVDGIPVLSHRVLHEIPNRWEYETLNWAYVKRNGICLIRYGDWFEWDTSEEYYQLADFETLLDSLSANYTTSESLGVAPYHVCVERMQLYLYPVSQGKGKYLLYPVWICTECLTSEDGSVMERNVALDAITGNQMDDLR